MTFLLTVFGVPLSISSLEGLIRSLLVSSFFFKFQICGSHSIFQKNYSLCDAFVKKIASFSKNQEYFWKHAKTVSFYSKWEISFLFSLYVVLTSLDCVLYITFSRFHDIADFHIVETKETRREGNNCQYSTKEETRDSIPFGFCQCTLLHFCIHQITYSLISHIYMQDVYINQCCQSLMQLALALLERFYLYVEDTLEV